MQTENHILLMIYFVWRGGKTNVSKSSVTKSDCYRMLVACNKQGIPSSQNLLFLQICLGNPPNGAIRKRLLAALQCQCTGVVFSGPCPLDQIVVDGRRVSGGDCRDQKFECFAITGYLGK